MSFGTDVSSTSAMGADYLGTVVSADGELLQLVRGSGYDGQTQAGDIVVQGQQHRFRVPAYAVKDLGHGSLQAGFDTLVAMLEESDLSDDAALSPLRMQLTEL